MNFGVVVFPGSNCDHDCYHVFKHVFEQDVRYIWHKETNLGTLDAVILPGGFSYGDYLRTGAIARLSPVMEAVIQFAERGGLVIGICNGFQILCEAALLPGALMRNESLRFVCKFANLRVDNQESACTLLCRRGEVLRVPIAHGDGKYFADEATLASLNENNQVLFRYSDESGNVTARENPNGSVQNIAGLVNAAGNVIGMMPHPDRCSEAILGSDDGAKIIGSILAWHRRN